MSRSIIIKSPFAAVLGAVLLTAYIALPRSAMAEPFRLIITETEMPLVPNSVQDLALRLGYYKRAGVDVDLVRVQQTPSAVAALRSGEGDMANISFDTALQLVANDQMKLKGVVSPDSSLPFLIATKKSLTQPKSLEGKTFGVARIGGVDYTLTRTVLQKLGVDPDKLQYLAVGQPPVRARALAVGQVDATALSIGVWITMPDKSNVSVMVDQPEFYKLAPFISKLNFVTASTAQTKAKQIEGVVRGIILASRDFAEHPEDWVNAMAEARPDVARKDLETLAQAYRKSWSINGGLDLQAIKFTSAMTYQGADFKDLRQVQPSEWIDTGFVDAVLKEIGVKSGGTETGQ
jgi:NitT/TauT family transport system substrate-binding protein